MTRTIDTDSLQIIPSRVIDGRWLVRHHGVHVGGIVARMINGYRVYRTVSVEDPVTESALAHDTFETALVALLPAVR